jgi:hypothetical protein
VRFQRRGEMRRRGIALVEANLRRVDRRFDIAFDDIGQEADLVVGDDRLIGGIEPPGARFIGDL